MPSKTRWRLNPKKWFGHKSHAGQKQESMTVQQLIPPPTATTTTRSITTISTNLSDRSKTRVVPISFSNVMNRQHTVANPFQMPAFRFQRQRNTFQHTEPTIRKNSRIEENLAFDITRVNISSIVQTKIPEDFEQDEPEKPLEISILDLSHRCVVDYPREISNQTQNKTSLPSRSSSSSALSLNDGSDSSSSSGIFTDERQRTESKETLSNLEVLSIESIADSQMSMNQIPTRPIIHHHRRPVSVFELTDDKPQKRQTPFEQSQRCQSAEGILKDTQTISPNKSRQPSAAIMKKLDKRPTTSRSPSTALIKSGFVRVANDTYRLTGSTVNHFSFDTRRELNPSYDHDDVLRSANDEAWYATLPRTTSTEQLHNTQTDLRMIVDECIRPLRTSIGKTNPPIKPNNNRFRRTQTQLNIENISERLLASVDYRMYTRYQRCN